MARRTSGEVVPAATGKSRAEIAALRHLREAYEVLNLRADSIAERSPQKKPLSSRGRVLDTVRSLQAGQSEVSSPLRSRDVFSQWLALESLSHAIQSDEIALQREVESCEVRTKAAIRLPAEGYENLDPKLLVLSEVLGHTAFAEYSADLFREVATLRRRCSLYGDTLKQFREQVEIGCIGSNQIRDIVSHREWLEIANAAVTALRIQTGEPLLVSHFPVLMQHCSPPRMIREGENVVVVPEVLQLLERVTPARERLLALCFEQISDVRRGAGFVPPPEGVRPHKFAALAKQSHADALCSREELDQILIWLDEDNNEGFVTANEFRSFHTVISDTYIEEDAEFIAFLMRVWHFDIPRDLLVGDVVADYEARCQEITNKTRKTEVLKKVDHLRAALPSKLASLRSQIGQMNQLTVLNASHLELLASNNQLTTPTLGGLRALRLTGLGLREFPIFVVALPLLEELDLSENHLKDQLPLAAIGAMKSLRILLLRGNFLTDKSITMAGDPDMIVWAGLEALSSLDLAGNQLSMIPSIVINLKNLTQLDLANNKLRGSGISSETAKKWNAQGFPQLRVVDIRGNELSTLPDALLTTCRQTLEDLFAQDNYLTELPTSLLSAESLSQAVFSRNQLRHSAEMDFTPLLTRCIRLTGLTLDHNLLKCFPVVNPVNSTVVDGLQVVGLAKNWLRVLPPLGNMRFQECSELDLRGNKISEISEDFFIAFPHLRFCFLQQNALKHLPESISSCKKLQTLEVHENKLESVTVSLASLRELATLNLRDNQLTSIPTEWHIFASYYDESHHHRPRILQKLNLQRSPLRDKVLEALVDGVGGGATFKSDTTQICETYIRKLIDTLKQSIPVQKLARIVHVEPSDDHGDDEEGDKEPRRRWKGRARFALQHLESQLRIKCENTEGPLLVATAVFKKLLQKLMGASTEKEIQLMAGRFQAKAGLVDGVAFLHAVEAVGLFNSFETQTDTSIGKSRSESVRKPVDAVASILHYLQVSHELKTSPLQPNRSGKPDPLARPRVTNRSSPASPPRRPQSAKTTREPAAKPANKPREKSPEVVHYRRKLERERQRIRVLEQQLTDERLLRLCAPRPAEATVEAVLPQEQQPSRPGASVLVHIKQLNRDMTPKPEAGDVVVVAVAADATVLQLKEAIAKRLGVDVTRQVLIAKHATQDHVRLRDDEALAVYGCVTTRWTVSLIVSERLRVVWAREHAGTTPQGSTGDPVDAPSQIGVAGHDVSSSASRQCERAAAGP